MALRGSLHEFELPDIFQLIGNDGKTGQLVLYNKDDEAFVIFSHGSVIAAGNNAMNLQTVLFKFLMSIKHYSEEELNELLYLCQGEMRLFTQELVNKRYVVKEELATIARLAIEDLACGLFLWEFGHYRFDSLDNVDDYMVGAIALSSDAITMEAMRRVDEWKRIRKAVHPETVFVRVKQNENSQQPPNEPRQIFDPAAHMLSLVDGMTTVASFCKTTFFTEYRLCETLLSFWQNNRILPIKGQQEHSKSVKTQGIAKTSFFINLRVLSFVLVHLAALLVIYCGYVFKHTVLREKNLAQSWSRYEWPVIQSENNIRVATIDYHALKGMLPTATRQLKNAGLIVSTDEIYFNLRDVRAHK
jgi:Domain of unknown function (DUF4388)